MQISIIFNKNFDWKINFIILKNIIIVLLINLNCLKFFLLICLYIHL